MCSTSQNYYQILQVMRSCEFELFLAAVTTAENGQKSRAMERQYSKNTRVGSTLITTLFIHVAKHHEETYNMRLHTSFTVQHLLIFIYALVTNVCLHGTKKISGYIRHYIFMVGKNSVTSGSVQCM